MKVSQLLLHTKKFNPKALNVLKSSKKPQFIFRFYAERPDGFKEFKINVIAYDVKTLKPTNYILHFMIKDSPPLDIEYERFSDSEGYESKFLNSAEVAVLYLYMNNKENFLKLARNN